MSELAWEVQWLNLEVQRQADLLANAPALRVTDLMQRYDCSRATVYRHHLSDPAFPRPIPGPTWRPAEVAAWEAWNTPDH